MDPQSKCFRYVILLLNCLISFGTYFCFDMPSVLQSQFQGNTTCDNSSEPGGNFSCCTDCLDLKPDQFNLLYAVWSWTGAATVFFNGFLIDKIGNRAASILFSLLTTAASALFAVATLDGVRGSCFMFPLLILGRVIFGISSGSLRIVQDRLTSFWFKDKELSMAFGATVSSARLGSVLNFLITESFALKYGLSWALWGGSVFCGVGLICAVLASHIDTYGVKKLGLSQVIREESKNVKISEVKEFTLQYWLLLLSIVFFYSSVLPFVADASLYTQEKYGIDEVTAGYIAGAVFDTSVVLSPILGYIADIFGGSGYASIISCVLAVPVFVLLALTRIPPLAATLWLGVLYSLGAIGMWSRIPYLSERKHLGTAMGMVTCCQGLGVGLSNFIIATISLLSVCYLASSSLQYSEKLRRWKLVMIPLGSFASMGSIFIIILNVIDIKRGGIMNKASLMNQTSSETEPLIRNDDDDDLEVN